MGGQDEQLQPGLSLLVLRITARAEDTGDWAVSSEEVMEALGVTPEQFWRAVHGARNRIAFPDAIDGYTQETVGDLVTVLETLAGQNAEEVLVKAGLFIPHRLGVELAAQFLQDAGRFAAAHVVRREELSAMHRHAGSVRGAVEIYVNEYADLDALREISAESFRTMQGMPDVGHATAARYIRKLFERHILDRRSVIAVLETRLREALEGLGYVDPDSREGQGGARPATGITGRRAWARKVFGFDDRSIPPAELRARYRKLMMRHHPDVDPRGLEKCKDVNAAYSLLVSEVSGESA